MNTLEILDKIREKSNKGATALYVEIYQEHIVNNLLNM